MDSEVTITRYKSSRYWAVWINGELLAVVCYRKGAEAVRTALTDADKFATSIMAQHSSCCHIREDM